MFEVVMYLLYTIIWLAAILGNGFIIYIVIKEKPMQTVTNLFILNLAVGDVLMAALCIPSTFVADLLLHYWPFGSFMCNIVGYSQAVTVFISAYTLIAISIDKYRAILHPLKSRITEMNTKLIIMIIWFISLVTPLPTAILSKLKKMNLNSPHMTCIEDWNDNNKRYYYSLTLMSLQYIFPLTVLIYTYVRIAVVLFAKQTPGEAEDQRDQRIRASKRKMIKMMMLCVLSYAVCWLPLNTIILIGDKMPDIWKHQYIMIIWISSHWLAMSHSSYNPIIIFTMNAKFRLSLKQLFTNRRSQRSIRTPTLLATINNNLQIRQSI
ncbi:RYamide receptor-like [Oppia nitens]|uniref:RYamide receptor-like n=1 Tax=Oppia nitens TaxID=1686743 RepID=UPI0023DBD618|nr:RYamide receptor-like [Oppia nitens]